MPPTKKTLNAALLAAQKDLNAVAKDSRNQHQRYDYVSAENMIGECRQVLHAHGLTLTAGNVELMPFGDTQYGEAVLVSHGMRLTYGDEVLELTRAWPAVPGKGRPLDKAVAGALTANLSYTLRDLLLIPRGDEPGVGMDDTDRAPAPAPAPRAPAPRAPAPARSPAPASTPKSVADLVGSDEPACPHCASRLYDNRNDPNRKPKAPLWKCSNRDCGGGSNGWPWASWEDWPFEFGNGPDFVAQNEPEQPPPPEAPHDERGEQFDPDVLPF
tara:strand:+ start:5849 stop:6661 length:813 start_codon:yes stop_codon:yes gene_type:complete